jgi:hypothetical protein
MTNIADVLDVLSLPSSQPYTPHSFDVVCKNGHVLVFAGDVFRVAKGKPGETKVWAKTHSNDVVMKTTKGTDAYIVNISKTIERAALNSNVTECVTQAAAVCKACGDDRWVGTLYRNYVDCSDFSVDGGAGRFHAAPLSLMLLCQDGCVLRARFRAGSTPADLELFSGSAVRDDKHNAERLLSSLCTSSPTLQALLNIHLPDQPDSKWIRGLERHNLKPDSRRYVLSTAIAAHFGHACERLQGLLACVGNFLLASGLPHQHHTKMFTKTVLFSPGEYSQAVATFFDKRRAQINHSALDFLLREAVRTQVRQMHSPPDVYSDSTQLREISVWFITRNVTAHSEDTSGCQRRHLLRLFANAFGGGVLGKASDLVGEAIEVLQLSKESELCTRMLIVVDPTAPALPLADREAGLNAVVASIRAHVESLQ